MKSRNADRTTRVAAHAHGCKVRGNCRTSATTRPTRVAIQYIRISGCTKQRANCENTVGKLMHVGLRNYDSACRTQLLYEGGVVGWYPSYHRNRAVGRLHTNRLVIVFDNDRYSMEQAPRFSRPSFSIHSGGLFKRLAVDDADRVQCRSTLVVCIDAGQIC